jgi:glycosyltransferase involved in cell wall biosynthesis
MTMQAVEVEIEDDVPDTVFKITKATLKAAELSVIVPTFNERDNIKAVIAAVADALPNIAWEIIFVDDNSSDGTASFVREIARIDPRVRCSCIASGAGVSLRPAWKE